MKRFLIILLGLLCAPLVVKGAWELVLWCLSLNIPVFFLAIAIAVVMIFLEFSVGTNYQPRLKELISMRKAECDSTPENHLIEQINKKYDAAEETLLQKTIAQKCNYEEIQYGKIMSVFTAILFFVPILVGSYKYFGAEAIGNIIVTDDAIYSPKGAIIADPKTYGWQKIERDGETYIQYGSWNDSEIYDLNGNLVKVEEGL